ncbi:MAG: hypothetical protein ACRD3A_00830 [Terriglobales bacterium]
MEKQSMVRLTYRLGWFFLLAAFAFRALLLTASGHQLVRATTVLPHNFLQLSALFFLICLATWAYGQADSK